MIREDPGSGQPVPTSSRPGIVRRALHASFLSPYVELLRVVGFLRETNVRTRTTPASNGGFSPGVHLFPFRTESLSPGAPMVLPSPVGESVAANFIEGILMDASPQS